MSTSPAPPTPPKDFKVACLQLGVSADKKGNISGAVDAIEKAASQGAQVIVLPECWNCPYSTAVFKEYGESVPDGPSLTAVRASAKKHGVVIIAGSIPELAGKNDAHAKRGVYNTSVAINTDGSVLAIHRKVHLFDIDVPGGVSFKESDGLDAGQSVTTFNTPYGVFGLGICYDIRFPEYAQLLRQRGAVALFYPGAFNTTTGPRHWELLQRARAVDNQCWVITASPARDPDFSYQAWGHSMVVSPWGSVMTELDEKPGIAYAEVKMDEVSEFRTAVPTFTQRRDDLYSLVDRAATK